MGLDLKDFAYDGEGGFDLKDYPTNAHVDAGERERYELLTAGNTRRMAELQDKLYADAREGVVAMFQAMDAAGLGIGRESTQDSPWLDTIAVADADIAVVELAGHVLRRQFFLFV